MNIAAIITLGIVGVLTGCKDQPVQSSQQILGDEKYRLIMALPEGIEVVHSPDKVLAVQGGRSGFEYTWLHKTTIRSKKESLKIVEFGSFAEVSGKWVFSTYTGEPFSPDDFEEWYSCPGAILEGEKPFTDPNNWSGAVNLHESASLWYYIGVDSSGKKYRGSGKVENLAQIKGD